MNAPCEDQRQPPKQRNCLLHPSGVCKCRPPWRPTNHHQPEMVLEHRGGLALAFPWLKWTWYNQLPPCGDKHNCSNMNRTCPLLCVPGRTAQMQRPRGNKSTHETDEPMNRDLTGVSRNALRMLLERWTCKWSPCVPPPVAKSPPTLLETPRAFDTRTRTPTTPAINARKPAVANMLAPAAGACSTPAGARTGPLANGLTGDIDIPLLSERDAHLVAGLRDIERPQIP